MSTEVMTNWRNRRLRSKPHRYRDELREDECMPAFDMSADESKYLRDHKEFCDLLSKYGDEDSEEGSEASKKRYATIALSSCDDENYELVETGPLAVAYTPTGRILHFNLKAKDIDEPSAAVETFFGELTETNTNDFIVENVICLGSSDSLPAKPETHGCLYCGSRAIHHPESPMCFRRGGEYHWEFLCSVVPKIRDYIKEGLQEDQKLRLKVQEEQEAEYDDFTNPDAWVESGNFPSLIQPQFVEEDLVVPDSPTHLIEKGDAQWLKTHPHSARRLAKIKERRLLALVPPESQFKEGHNTSAIQYLIEKKKEDYCFPYIVRRRKQN